MNKKYISYIVITFLLTAITVLTFDFIAIYTGEAIPFMLVLLFGISTLLSLVLLGSTIYKKDLERRTLEELERIEKEEEST